MKILAIARPNIKYRWYNCISMIILQAHLNDKRIAYYEIYQGRLPRRVPEQLVEELFPANIRLKDRPFLAKENPDFYAVLNRHKKRYKVAYQKLLKNK